MIFTFYKYQGTGNDFIMIDNRDQSFPKDNLELIATLCNRHFGIGADGIILIENDEKVDFKMRYFNADGSETFCGNGARCAVAFAYFLEIITCKTTFNACDGDHQAEIENDLISLQMIDVDDISIIDNTAFLYTGTQHHVELVDKLDDYPVYKHGKKIRNSYDFPGSNVNFVQKINNNTFRVRTYEKGVEGETLACGTGVTAAAIAMHSIKQTASHAITLPVEGGLLEVSFDVVNNNYRNICLKGPAQFVFKGSFDTE